MEVNQCAVLTRANVLLITAGLGIVVGHVDGNTAVGGCIISVVTFLAGKFATDFEFGGSSFLWRYLQR